MLLLDRSQLPLAVLQTFRNSTQQVDCDERLQQLGDDTLVSLLVVLEVLVVERLERRARPPLALPGCGRRRTCSKIRGTSWLFKANRKPS